jgi:hypothetical protein
MFCVYDLTPTQARYEFDIHRLANKNRADRQALYQFYAPRLLAGDPLALAEYNAASDILKETYEWNTSVLSSSYRTSTQLLVRDTFERLALKLLEKKRDTMQPGFTFARFAKSLLYKQRVHNSIKFVHDHFEAKINAEFSLLEWTHARQDEFESHFAKYGRFYAKFEDGVQ